MNAQPVFCCPDMARFFAGGDVTLTPISNDGRVIVSIGHYSDGIPLNYCPSCGKEFRLTFMTDSEVYR